jgi:hypothetical protein
MVTISASAPRTTMLTPRAAMASTTRIDSSRR